MAQLQFRDAFWVSGVDRGRQACRTGPARQAGITLETDIGVQFSHNSCALTLALIIMQVAWATVSTDTEGTRGALAKIMNFCHNYHSHSQQRDGLCTPRLILLWDMLAPAVGLARQPNEGFKEDM